MPDLIDQLDQYLLDRPKRDQKQRWYPTDMLKCGRQLFYKKTIEKPSNPIEAGALWKMEAGNALHDMIVGFIREAIDPDVEEEVEFLGPLDGLPGEEAADPAAPWIISGRVDAVFTQNGKKTAAEIKTSYGQGIKRIQQLGQPKKDHLAQAICYLELTDIEEIWLLYFGRDNGYRTVFKIRLNAPERPVCEHNGVETYIDQSLYFDSLMARLRPIEAMIKAGEMPDRDFQAAIVKGEVKDKFVRQGKTFKSDWQCSYCDFQSLCWIDEMLKHADGDNSASFRG